MTSYLKRVSLVFACMLVCTASGYAGEGTSQLLDRMLAQYRESSDQLLPAIPAHPIAELQSPEILDWNYSLQTLISSGSVQGTILKRKFYLRMVYKEPEFDDYTQAYIAPAYAALFDMTESTNSVTARAMVALDGQPHITRFIIPNGTAGAVVFLVTRIGDDGGITVLVQYQGTTPYPTITTTYQELKARWLKVSQPFCRNILGRSLCLVPQEAYYDQLWHIGYVVSHGKPVSDISGHPEDYVDIATYEGVGWTLKAKTYSRAAGLQFLHGSGWSWQVSDIQPTALVSQ